MQAYNTGDYSGREIQEVQLNVDVDKHGCGCGGNNLGSIRICMDRVGVSSLSGPMWPNGGGFCDIAQATPVWITTFSRCGRTLIATFPRKASDVITTSGVFVYRYPAGWELGARAALLHEGKGGSAAHGRREEIKG